MNSGASLKGYINTLSLEEVLSLSTGFFVKEIVLFSLKYETPKPNRYKGNFLNRLLGAFLGNFVLHSQMPSKK